MVSGQRDCGSPRRGKPDCGAHSRRRRNRRARSRETARHLKPPPLSATPCRGVRTVMAMERGVRCGRSCKARRTHALFHVSHHPPRSAAGIGARAHPPAGRRPRELRGTWHLKIPTEYRAGSRHSPRGASPRSALFNQNRHPMHPSEPDWARGILIHPCVGAVV